MSKNATVLYRKILERYGEIDDIWSFGDKWHYHVYKKIYNFISKYNKKSIFSDKIVLNAGSGCCTYDIRCREMTCVDLSINLIKKIDGGICASVEYLPFKSESFDAIICVGSVINYCDAASVICELQRVLRENGIIIIEYESSCSFEYILGDDFCKPSSFVKTRYQGTDEYLWMYSDDYVINLLESFGMTLLDVEKIHILSSLLYFFTKSYNISSKLSFFDVILNALPFFKKYSSNTIICCGKNL